MRSKVHVLIRKGKEILGRKENAAKWMTLDSVRYIFFEKKYHK